jgi:hypothetical protein
LMTANTAGTRNATHFSTNTISGKNSVIQMRGGKVVYQLRRVCLPSMLRPRELAALQSQTPSSRLLLSQHTVYALNCTMHSYAMRELELCMQGVLTSATCTGVGGIVKSNDRNYATHQEQCISGCTATTATVARILAALLHWLWQIIYTVFYTCRLR